MTSSPVRQRQPAPLRLQIHLRGISGAGTRSCEPLCNALPCSWPPAKDNHGLFKIKTAGQVAKSSKLDPSCPIHRVSKEHTSLEMMLLEMASACQPWKNVGFLLSRHWICQGAEMSPSCCCGLLNGSSCGGMAGNADAEGRA